MGVKGCVCGGGVCQNKCFGQISHNNWSRSSNCTRGSEICANHLCMSTNRQQEGIDREVLAELTSPPPASPSSSTSSPAKKSGRSEKCVSGGRSGVSADGNRRRQGSRIARHASSRRAHSPAKRGMCTCYVLVFAITFFFPCVLVIVSDLDS